MRSVHDSDQARKATYIIYRIENERVALGLGMLATEKLTLQMSEPVKAIVGGSCR